MKLNTEPENNAGAVVLKGDDIEALPDDPDDLAAALQALAGPSAGPNGGQIFVDGFTGGRLPPRASIREIRINSNPFSAEYDRLGFGRIEILTRPGTDRFRGQVSFNFNDDALNARNPFADSRPAIQTRQYGGNFGGPISKKKASFFIDFDKRDIDDGALIVAQVLDANNNIVDFIDSVAIPSRRTSFSPRIDYQINQNHTLVARYNYAKNTRLRESAASICRSAPTTPRTASKAFSSLKQQSSTRRSLTKPVSRLNASRLRRTPTIRSRRSTCRTRLRVADRRSATHTARRTTGNLPTTLHLQWAHTR